MGIIRLLMRIVLYKTATVLSIFDRQLAGMSFGLRSYDQISLARLAQRFWKATYARYS